jgi:hypothetical protein
MFIIFEEKKLIEKKLVEKNVTEKKCNFLNNLILSFS